MGYFEAHGADEANLEFKALPVRVADGAPPRAIYLCTIKATQAVSKAGNHMVSMVLKVEEPEEFAGQRVFDYFLFTRKRSRGESRFDKTIHHLTQIMGQEWVRELDGDLVKNIIPTIVSAIDGLPVGVQVGQREEEYLGETRTKNPVRNYFDQDVYFDGGEDGA